MKITFYARGRVVQARISDGSESYRISTGITIYPHLRFNGEFKGRSAEVAQLNADLSRTRIRLTELYLEHRDFKKVRELFEEKPPELPETETYILNDLFMRYIKYMVTGEVKSNGKKHYSKASIDIYRYVANLLNEYSHFYKPMDIRDYHIDPNWDAQKKRQVADDFANYWKKYEDYLIDRGLAIKSRSEIMNMTGIITKYWADRLFFSIPKIQRLDSHQKAIVVFDHQFVRKFLNDDDRMYNKLSPEQKFLWEISATILITTLRIGDAMSLTEKDLILTKDIVYLRKKNEKTGVYSEMPLPKFLSDIYRENLTRHGRIYSIQPDREVVYKGMKDFFRMYDDLHEIVSVADVDVRGKEFIVSKPLWEWVHPHLLRKTAITTMIYNKVPERFIKFASGHSTNSTAFERYVGHVEKYYKSEINDYYGKMFN